MAAPTRCDPSVLKPDVDVTLRPPMPAPLRVARRALALAALACRSQLEPHAADAEARAIHDGVREWIVAVGVAAELEPDELAIVHAPLGELSREDAAIAGWRGEGAAVLAWGLGRWTLPAIDVPVDASEVALALGWLEDAPVALADDARLRARTDVVQLAEMLEAAQWSLDRALAREPSVSLRTFDAGTFRWPRDAAPLAFAADGALALAGQPLGTAPEQLQRLVRRVVVERRVAVNWLAGQNARYSAVTIET